MNSGFRPPFPLPFVSCFVSGPARGIMFSYHGKGETPHFIVWCKDIMKTDRLKQWATLLLDTGKRNNLIHFRDSKTSGPEFLSPDASEIFRRMHDGKSAVIFDTESDSGQSAEEAGDRSSLYSAYAAAAGSNLLPYHATASPAEVLPKVEKRARDFMEETGVNVLHLAFGWIHWTDPDEKDTPRRAPVLLIPVALKRASSVDPWQLQPYGDEVIVNPTFRYKLEAELGLTLPEWNDETLDEYLAKVQDIVRKPGYTVEKVCILGTFSFQKINMYKDLTDYADIVSAHPNIRALLGAADGNPRTGEADAVRPADTEPVSLSGPSRETSPAFGYGADPEYDPLMDSFCVVDADGSQLKALEMVRAGKSFVLQGPPGTGKSQTITNLIAQCLGEGKRVLFVSEKRAALNVVYDKLKQADLSEFCLELHSHKANKKDFIAELVRTLRLPRTVMRETAETTLQRKDDAMKQLNQHAQALHRNRPEYGMSLYEIYEAYVESAAGGDSLLVIADSTTRGAEALHRSLDRLERYAGFVPSVGDDYRKNCWYGFCKDVNGYDALQAYKGDLQQAADTVGSLIPDGEIRTLTDFSILTRFGNLVSRSGLWTPQMMNPGATAQVRAVLTDLQTLSAQLAQTETPLFADYRPEILQQIPGATFEAMLQNECNGFFKRLFNGQWKTAVKTLQSLHRSGRKPDYDEALRVASLLRAHQEQSYAFDQREALIRTLTGPALQGRSTDFGAALQELQALEQLQSEAARYGQDNPLERFRQNGVAANRSGFSERVSRWNRLMQDHGAALQNVTRSFNPQIRNLSAMSLNALREHLNTCLLQLPALENWNRFSELLREMEQDGLLPFVHEGIDQGIAPETVALRYKRSLMRHRIEAVHYQEPELAAFHRIEQDQTVETFRETDKLQFEINKARIRETLSARRPSTDIVTAGSPLSVLLREGEKKRMQKPIRTLLQEIPELILTLKPCFLMSPLSVGTFLECGKEPFDVVVFDEASQIFPQDALGAICRGKQLVVVGDSRQMPPTDFFRSAVDTGSSDEDDGETDFESILDLASTVFPQLRLRWHYRSRYEELIAFSNRNFYDGQLVSFPATGRNKVDTGVEYVPVEGIFDRSTKTNSAEADAVVRLVSDHIRNHPGRSLGVVAFSMSQQRLIADRIDAWRKDHPEQDAFFNPDVKEPFFVKNLETVQGDERDTVIFSVAYGMGSDGRLINNFGPLNKEGGERRLNVAVTRAKINIKLVSSMHYDQIQLSNTASRGARLLREYLDFAENGEAAFLRSSGPGAISKEFGALELSVKRFLESSGYPTDMQVGTGAMTIDLAVRTPASGPAPSSPSVFAEFDEAERAETEYLIAVEADGPQYRDAENARDRDRLRREVLERMGWRYYRLWSTEWIKNPTVERDRLLAFVRSAVNAPEDNPPGRNETVADEDLSFTAETDADGFDPEAYRMADIDRFSKEYSKDFKAFVRAVLEVEAPLQEDWFLKRIVPLFGREKVTSAVRSSWKRLIAGSESYGFILRDGFLYRTDVEVKEIRTPGDVRRDFEQISLEELACGLRMILDQNLAAGKTDLFRSLAKVIGAARLTTPMTERFSQALSLLGDEITCDEENIVRRNRSVN